MRLIRLILGKLILFFDFAFPPKGIVRDPAAQAAIDAQTGDLVLYQYKACPFCVKVRRAMKRQGLTIETRDVKRSDSAREELLNGGGDLQVPCLLVPAAEGSTQWIYESDAIIGYLENRFMMS